MYTCQHARGVVALGRRVWLPLAFNDSFFLVLLELSWFELLSKTIHDVNKALTTISSSLLSFFFLSLLLLVSLPSFFSVKEHGCFVFALSISIIVPQF